MGDYYSETQKVLNFFFLGMKYMDVGLMTIQQSQEYLTWETNPLG